MLSKKIKLSLKDIHNLYVPLNLILDDEITKKGLKIWAYIRLIEIEEIICELTIDELQEITKISQSELTKYIGRLVENGHLKRYKKPNSTKWITETIS